MALYYGSILCVSNSSFTIKTAALAWFLFGVMVAAELLPTGYRDSCRPVSGWVPDLAFEHAGPPDGILVNVP